MFRVGAAKSGGLGDKSPPVGSRSVFVNVHKTYKSHFSRDVVSVLNVSVSRRFFGTSRLVSVLKVEHLSLVSVSRVWNNRTSWSRLGLEGSTSRSRLGLEDITSGSRSRDFSLVNMLAMRIYPEENNGCDPQETRCQVRDFTSWCF